MDGAVVRAAGLLVVGSRAAGLYADGVGSRIEATDVVVRDTLPDDHGTAGFGVEVVGGAARGSSGHGSRRGACLTDGVVFRGNERNFDGTTLPAPMAAFESSTLPGGTRQPGESPTRGKRVMAYDRAMRKTVSLVAVAALLAAPTLARSQSRTYYSTRYVAVGPPEHLQVGDATFDASFGGFRDYLESIRVSDPELYAAMDPRLSAVQTRRTAGWLTFGLGMGVGVGLMLVPTLVREPGDDFSVAPVLLGGLVAIAGVLIGLGLQPGRSALGDLIDAHNASGPAARMSLELGDRHTAMRIPPPPVRPPPATVPAAPVAAPPSPPRELRAGPTEVAGFALGGTRAQATTVCEAAGGTMSPEAAQPGFDPVRCSVLPVTIEHIAQGPVLAFCGDSLCGVLLAVAPGTDTDEAWASAVRRIGRTLVARYGPLTPRFTGPAACRSDLEAGRLASYRAWDCRLRATVAFARGDVQLALSAGDAGLSATLQYRTTELRERMETAAHPETAPVTGAEHL